MKVVAIGAHPDDAEFGVFGTLRRHAEAGDEVTLLVLTRGERGGPPAVREVEAREAAGTLRGAKVVFGSFQDGYLRDNHKLVDWLEGSVGGGRADVLYAHSAHDRHQDHRYASMASATAGRFADTVLLYETASTTWGFIPQVFVSIGQEGLDLKLKALGAHRSQREKRYLEDEAVAGLAKFRAYQAGLHSGLAEAFEVVREVRR